MKERKMELNSKQKAVLEYIAHCIHQEHYCPSVREIGAEVGLSSTSSVQNHITNLERLGYLLRKSNRNRSIQLTDLALSILPSEMLAKEKASNDLLDGAQSYSFLGETVKTVPLVGQVQAGAPITAIENHESDLLLPVALTGHSDCFLLRVQGDSMRNIGMLEGDMLIVRNQSTATNGDIVVARIDEEATVKRFFKEKDHIRLQPENEDYEPILVENCIIEGKVIGLIRDHL